MALGFWSLGGHAASAPATSFLQALWSGCILEPLSLFLALGQVKSGWQGGQAAWCHVCPISVRAVPTCAFAKACPTSGRNLAILRACKHQSAGAQPQRRLHLPGRRALGRRSLLDLSL